MDAVSTFHREDVTAKIFPLASPAWEYAVTSEFLSSLADRQAAAGHTARY